ncbi:MAG: ribosome small subunit-dependent GTPase A [Vulcanimicrobiaceae bacterium]
MRGREDQRRARVTSVGRNAAWVVFDDEIEPRLAALRKTADRGALVPGDLVIARPIDDGRVLVERREPRAFELARTTAGGRRKVMAANVDTLAVVAAFDNPPPHLEMIDELLAFAELHELAGTLILTKPDLVATAVAETLVAIYRGLGYPVLVVNPKSRTGIDAVTAQLDRRHALLIGQSGVGKSSLYGALGGTAKVGALSKIGRGRQTTTAARLHRFPAGFMIDSPGVAEFALRAINPAELADAFVEFRPLVRSCRFSDCVHRSEPDCAIRTAVADGRIAASRYASYCAILGRPA